MFPLRIGKTQKSNINTEQKEMKQLMLLLAGLIAGCHLSAQTIVDLNRGGSVRAKTADDYNRENADIAARLRADSIAYNDRLVRGLNALHTDSLALAKQLFEDALKLRPTAPSNYIVRQHLGRIEMAWLRYEEAIEIFSKILKEQTLLREVRLDRATCYFELNNLQAALADCDVIATGEQRDEIYVRTLFLRSATHRRARRAELAKADLEEILRVQPENLSAQLLLPLCLEQLGQPQEALARLNLFVAAHPEVVDGWAARAELELRQGKAELARADYDKAIALAPKDAALRVARARLLLQMGAKASARKDLDEAVRLGVSKRELSALYTQL